MTDPRRLPARRSAAFAAELLHRANDVSTPPDQLRELADPGTSRAVKEAVAANPNTPADVLLGLAGRYWSSFLANPALPLLLLEDPGLLGRLPLRALRTLIRQPTVPPFILQTLARHADREVREGARLHVALTPAPPASASGGDSATDSAPDSVAPPADWQQTLQAELAKLPAPQGTLPELLALDVLAPWLLPAVAGTTNPKVRTAIIVNSQRPTASPSLQSVGGLLRRAFGEWKTTIREYTWGDSEYRYLAGRGSLTDAEVARFARGSRAWQRLAATTPNLAVADLERLARNADPAIGAALAGHPRLTPTATTLLLARANPRVLRSLAQSPYVPESVLLNLARAADAAVRRGVARNAQTPASILTQLAVDADDTVRLAVAGHRNTPPATLAQLLTSAERVVRQRVSRNHRCDAACYELLLADPDEEVRETLARRSKLPTAILRRLLDDPSRTVRHAAAYNRSTPKHIRRFMYDCAMDPPAERPPLPEWGPGKGWGYPARKRDPHVTSADDHLVTRCYSGRATSEEQHAAASSSAMPVRRAVAFKTTLPELLARLADDPEAEVRQALAGNKAAPLDVLRRLLTDPADQVRAGLAGNSQHPDPGMPELLRALAADPAESVRERLAVNRLVPADVIDLLADDSATVRGPVPFNPAATAATLARLAADARTTSNMRRGILIHANTPADVLRTLYTEGAPSVVERLIQNPNLPADLMRRIVTDHADRDDVWTALASNPTTPADLLTQLWERPAIPGKHLGWAVARHPNAPDELLERIVTDPDPHVASAVRGNPRFSPELLRRLLPLITEPQTKDYLTYGSDVPAFVFEVMAEEDTPEAAQRLARAAAPAAIHEALVQHSPPSDDVAYWLTRNKNAAPEILEQLLDRYAELDAQRGPWWWYRYLATSPRATSALLTRLVARLTDPPAPGTYRAQYPEPVDAETALNLVTNPLLDPALLHRFVEHPAREVRYALLNRADLPPELRPQLRAVVLRRNLAKPASALSRASALADAATTAEQLRALYYSAAGWLARVAMVANPNLPPDLLDRLADDAHQLVRAAARERRATGQIPAVLAAPANDAPV